MKQVERDHYILFNKVTNRKYFFKDSEPFLHLNLQSVGSSSISKALMNEYNESFSAASRKSQNYRIQGTAADISKLAVIIFFKWIISKDLLNIVKIVNFVHDEICVECPKEMATLVSDKITQAMEVAADNFCKTIPLKAAAEVGDYWIH